MRSRRTSSIAIKGLLLALLSLCLFAGHALAGRAVGTVTHLSGPLLVKKLDGTTRVLTRNSTVEEGDTLITEKRTYARIRFIDSSDVTLRPGTLFKVERFAYDEKAPKGDSAVMSLVKGGLRSVTGKIGKRGNQDAYEMKTPSATIGVRGTAYGATFCQGGECGKLPAGLYVDVAEGKIVVTNKGGAQLFTAGQFGFVPSLHAPPVILPKNPGASFTPPPAMTTGPASTGPQKGGQPASPAPKPVDCEVR
ncbi:MAG TPA: FecR family protein [Desulfuromonadaceae bacterium]